MSDFAARPRSPRQIWAAPGSNHDRLVAVARIVMPIMVGVLAAFLVMMPLANAGEVSFLLDKNKVDVAKERLRLQSALYRGTDGKGQPFTLTAGSAVQKSSAEPIVRIEQLAAKLQLSDGPARIVAPRGRYDMESQKVALVGPVNVVAANGYRLDTENSTIDLKTRQMQSGGAVTGTVPQGDFSANRLSADLANHVVRLDGNARLRIVPRKAK
jgi:lipopolysaccharide export system protein LptC